MVDVPHLRGLALPLLSTTHLLFILTEWPGLSDTGLVIALLCERDLSAALRYFIGLPYSHGHRDNLKYYLTKRLRRTPVPRLEELSTLFPRLSALAPDENGVLVPRFGPLTDQETGLWDSHTFFFQLLHAKKMEGTIPYPRLHFCMSLTLFSNADLRFL